MLMGMFTLPVSSVTAHASLVLQRCYVREHVIGLETFQKVGDGSKCCICTCNSHVIYVCIPTQSQLCT